jgi:hypothetical protein
MASLNALYSSWHVGSLISIAQVEADGRMLKLKSNETVHFFSKPWGGMHSDPVKKVKSSCKVQPACPVRVEK